MRIHDITVSLSSDLPIYPGDPGINIEPFSRISQGDSANVSRICMGSHSGTHLDAPFHFDDAGTTVDEIALETVIGKALVLEILGVKEIGRQELEKFRIEGEERLLLKTDNSKLWQQKEFSEGYAALTKEGAQYLRDAGVRLVGIDYLSIEGFHGEGNVHRTLLEDGILVIEGLNLEGIKAGRYQLICLPLKLKGGDGAPVRALLVGGSDSSALPEFDPHTSKWPLA